MHHISVRIVNGIFITGFTKYQSLTDFYVSLIIELYISISFRFWKKSSAPKYIQIQIVPMFASSKKHIHHIRHECQSGNEAKSKGKSIKSKLRNGVMCEITVFFFRFRKVLFGLKDLPRKGHQRKIDSVSLETIIFQ